MSAFYEIDVAFIALCLFFLFFAALVFYLRREDRREGFPAEEDGTGVLRSVGANILIPTPKTYILFGGVGKRTAPTYTGDKRPLALRRVSVAPGSPSEPTGNPLVDGVGPASYAERAKAPDLDSHLRPKIVPLRVDPAFAIVRGDVDPRGLPVYGCDNKIAGKVSDVWVDRPEALIRYVEVELANGGGVRVVPMPMCRIKSQRVLVDAVTAAQFADAPRLEKSDQITFYEEDRVSGYFGGGYLYATRARQEPLL